MQYMLVSTQRPDGDIVTAYVSLFMMSLLAPLAVKGPSGEIMKATRDDLTVMLIPHTDFSFAHMKN